jgi:hypothetical protein
MTMQKKSPAYSLMPGNLYWLVPRIVCYPCYVGGFFERGTLGREAPLKVFCKHFTCRPVVIQQSVQ